MSLQLWLPFNGNLLNKGILNTQTPNITPTYSTDARVGAKSLKTEGKVLYGIREGEISTHQMSFSFWVKSDNYTGSSTAWWQICSFECTDGTKFHVYSVPNARYKIEYSPELNLYCDTSVWNHLTYVLNGTNLTIYLNGVKSTSANVTNAQRVLSTISFGVSKVAINDFKMYNHCLSQTEVERDYATLLLHFPLRDANVENTTNLLPYPMPTTNATPAWDASLHPKATNVFGWSNGYNGGVGTPDKGYHAYWTVIDDIPTMKFQDLNKDIVSAHRWMGIVSNTTTNLTALIGPSVTYTVSYEARADVENKQVHSGIYYQINGASGKAFHDGQVFTKLTTKWKKYSYTKTMSANANTAVAGQFYMYGYSDSIEGTAYVRNLQIEVNNHATDYVKTSRLMAPVYDCSGRNHNSSNRGNIKISLDTNARNLNSTQFTPDNGIKFDNPFEQSTISECSVAFWLYLDATNNYMHIFSTNSKKPTSSGAGWLSVNCENYPLWFFSANNYWRASAGNLLPTEQWMHIVFVFKNGMVRYYLNGKPYGNSVSNTTATSFSATDTFSLGDTFTDTEWSSTPFNGKISDFRIYGVALTDTIVSDLYSNSATIDKSGNIHTFEFIEE